MVDDVKAVNEFMSEQQTGDVPDSSIFDNDYIEYVLHLLHIIGHVLISTFTETQRCLISQPVSSGLLSIGS